MWTVWQLYRKYLLLNYDWLATKRISKRGSVLEVRGGCYNYRFKLYMWLNVATKTVHSRKFIMAKALKWGMLHLCTLIFQYDIHKNALKSKYYYPDLIHRTSERSSYLFSLCTTMHCRLNVIFSLLTYIYFLARVHTPVAWFSVAPKIALGRRQLSFESKTWYWKLLH